MRCSYINLFFPSPHFFLYLNLVGVPSERLGCYMLKVNLQILISFFY